MKLLSVFELIFNWLGQNYPELCLIVALLIIGGVIVHFFYKFHYRIKRNEDDICSVNTRINTIESMRSDILTIKNFLMATQPRSASLFTQKMSPRKLNNNGIILLDMVEGMQFLENNKNRLLELISEKSPKTALDVEAFSTEILMELADDDIFSPIKDIVYKSPSITLKDANGNDVTYEFSFQDVLYVLSIPLRDMYLEINTHIIPEG